MKAILIFLLILVTVFAMATLKINLDMKVEKNGHIIKETGVSYEK